MINTVYFILLAAFWGCSFIAIKIVITHFPPMLGATLRVVISMLILTLIYKVFKKPFSIPKRHRLKIWFTGLFMQGIPFALLFWGQQAITPGLAGILDGTVPIWIFVLGLFFLKGDEVFSKQKLTGLVLGYIGIIIIFFPKLTMDESSSYLGVIAVTLMSISYAIGTVFNRRLLFRKHGINRYASLYHQHISSLVLIIIIMFLVEGGPHIQWTSESWQGLLALGYLALFSTALAWLMYFRLVEHWGAIRASSVTYTLPATALLADYFYFQQLPTLSEVLGGICILSGIILLQWKVKQPPPSPWSFRHGREIGKIKESLDSILKVGAIFHRDVSRTSV